MYIMAEITVIIIYLRNFSTACAVTSIKAKNTTNIFLQSSIRKHIKMILLNVTKTNQEYTNCSSFYILENPSF